MFFVLKSIFSDIDIAPLSFLFVYVNIYVGICAYTRVCVYFHHFIFSLLGHIVYMFPLKITYT